MIIHHMSYILKINIIRLMVNLDCEFLGLPIIHLGDPPPPSPSKSDITPLSP